MFYPYMYIGETRLTDALERELMIEAEQSYSTRSGEMLRAALRKAATILRRWFTGHGSMASAYWVSFPRQSA